MQTGDMSSAVVKNEKKVKLEPTEPTGVRFKKVKREPGDHGDPGASTMKNVQIKQEPGEPSDPSTPKRARKMHNTFQDYSPPIVKTHREAVRGGIVRERLSKGPSVPLRCDVGHVGGAVMQQHQVPHDDQENLFGLEILDDDDDDEA